MSYLEYNKPITQEQIDAALKMRTETHDGWRKICASLGTTEWKLRAAMDPNYRGQRNQLMKGRREKIRQGVWQKTRIRMPGPTQIGGVNAERVQSIDIPYCVLAERDERLARNHTSLTAALFGDPLPGYSALERRQI